MCYQTTSTLWRWGRNLFPKRRKTFASWRGCLTEKILFNTVEFMFTYWVYVLSGKGPVKGSCKHGCGYLTTLKFKETVKRWKHCFMEWHNWLISTFPRLSWFNRNVPLWRGIFYLTKLMKAPFDVIFTVPRTSNFKTFIQEQGQTKSHDT